MPLATAVNPSTPVSTVSSLALSNTMNTNAAAVQSGPYTKAQFQSTMEGSRTIKNSKEVEHLLRDYPAALELYRTGKYKVKVKCDAEVERVILVEKRITKVAASTLPATAPTTDDNQENNQTVPDLVSTFEEKKEANKTEVNRRSRSRTHSRDRVAPTVSDGNNIVQTKMSSMRMTSNTQPKVDHHRTPSRERDLSVTPPQKQHYHGRSQSRDSQHRASYGKPINREYPKMMVPFIPTANNSGHLWQQPRAQQPYFSNPILQQQKRSSFYLPSGFVPQQNPLYRQPYYYGQRPAVFPQQQSPFPPPTVRSVGKSVLYPTNTLTSSTRSVSNAMGLPPSFRTFHSNQQPPTLTPFQPIYPTQVPFPINHHHHPWTNVSNQPISALINNNGNYVEQQQREANNRAQSVETGSRNQPPAQASNTQPQPVVVVEHQHRRQPPPPTTAAPAMEKEKEPSSAVTGEKLTVRQLNESFLKTHPSGRVTYNSLPSIIERFGITLTENDVLSAANDLEYNVNEPISARRFIHILVKLGKITKSTQQQPQPRPPASPSMLPEDREVTDIMTQRKATVNQPNQWH